MEFVSNIEKKDEKCKMMYCNAPTEN